MGRKRTPGLRQRDGIWHIEKRIVGVPVFESCRTGNLAEAEAYLARRIEGVRKAKLFGVRPVRYWREAAIKYIEVKQDKRSLADDAIHLKALDPFIGNLPIDQVHDGTLVPYIEACRRKGLRTKSINNALGVVRHILNLCARAWRGEHGLTWLVTAPIITMETKKDGRLPYPLSWEEQSVLFQQLPGYLQRMALFKVNTGAREQEVCQLRWEWEVPVPEIGRSVFIVPGEIVKNKDDRLLVLNNVAWSVIEEQRGIHQEYVFPYGKKGGPMRWMNNTAWKRAWKQAGLPTGGDYLKGVHNLKHTFGRRLRSAGIPQETRKVLLGHRNGDITTHYSAAELDELLTAVNKVCQQQSGKSPALTLLKRKAVSAVTLTA